MTRPTAGQPDLPAAFGPLLTRLRRRAGLSQLAFALEAGVSARHLSFLESGRASPSRSMVERLARGLRATPSDLARLRHAAGFSAGPEADAARIGLAASDRLALEAFDAATAVAAATDAELAVEAAGRFFERIGITHFATGAIGRPVASQPVQVEMDRCGRPALGWLQHFWRRGYRHQDALVARTAAGAGAFFWTDLERGRLAPASRRILDEASEFRIRDGFVVSMPRHDGSIRAFTSWAERLDPDPLSRLAARLVATALIDSGERFAPERLAPRLPVQQRELLCAVRAGRSLELIARRHGLDLDAALRRACLDMGAQTPAHAASRAAALGLLAHGEPTT